jgi:hypothetical protein
MRRAHSEAEGSALRDVAPAGSRDKNSRRQVVGVFRSADFAAPRSGLFGRVEMTAAGQNSD